MAIKSRIILQGIPFCFGPAAHMLAIGKEIRKKFQNSIDLIALVDNSVYELISKSKLFDKIYKFTTNENLRTPILEILRSAEKIISIGDFDFVRIVAKAGLKISLVDPLLWMWENIPEEISLCDHYFALDFPGVEGRISSLKHKLENKDTLFRVNQICSAESSQVGQIIDNQSIIVHFGGLLNPMGINLDLVKTMIQDILVVIDEDESINSIIIRGGDKILKKIFRSIDFQSKKQIAFGSINQDIFYTELESCKAILSVPGMSIVFESLSLKKPFLFLLPLNYGQFCQMKSYKLIFQKPSAIEWENLDFIYSGLIDQDFREIGEYMKMSRKYSVDHNLRNKFKLILKDFLVFNNIKPLTPTFNTGCLNGASQIIDYLFFQ